MRNALVDITRRHTLVGQLFRSDSQTRTRSRFFVFLRCTVLRAERFEDLKYLSQDDLERSSLAEQRLDWPPLEPRIMR